jgi:hypothetical protein
MTRTDTAIRWITAATVLGLGLVAAIVSYQHGLDVAVAHGQHGWTARLTPLTIDGVVLAGGMILLACARAKDKAPKLAYATLAIGIGATLYVNGLYGASFGKVGIAVAAWPAVAFVFATELLMGLIRRSQTRADSTAAILITEASEAPGQPAIDETPQTEEVTEPVAEDLADATEPVDPAQALLDGVVSLMVSAKRSGISYEKIAALVPANTYQVTKAVKPLLSPQPSPDLTDLRDLDVTSRDIAIREHFADGVSAEQLGEATGLAEETVEDIASSDPAEDWARYVPAYPAAEDPLIDGRINGAVVAGADQ